MKKVIIAGGTGFLGKELENHLKKEGHQIFILTRSPKADNHIYWDATTAGSWAEVLDGADVLINLTGKCVDCRYHEANKKEIIRSRVESTNILNQVIQKLKQPPQLWLNASSATIYIHAESQLMTEANGIIGDDFSMNVCKKWEAAFFADTRADIRKVALRISIVLGNKGGAYPKMKWITRLGLGGHQGNGQQKVSWIHITDFCRAVDFIINTRELKGAINLAAPHPIANHELMKSIRQQHRMPFGISQPAALLEIGALLLGTETELLLKSRNVYPERLLNAGFIFQHEKIKEALAAL